MSNELIQFGKYKGQPLSAIQEDRQYIDWLLAQSWFREKHKDIYTIIINNFQEATETPQHNAMHVRFLNDAYVLDILSKYESDIKNYFVVNRSFERGGWDVVVDIWSFSEKEHDDVRRRAKEMLNKADNTRDVDESKNLRRQADDLDSSLKSFKFYIEIKPVVSDDFPAILRQIKAQHISSDSLGRNGIRILLVGEYTGIGATQDEFVAFMRNENITVVFANHSQ